MAERVIPPHQKDRLTPLTQKEFYPSLVQDIRSATNSIDMNFYIMTKDRKTRPIFDALLDAARRGVTVRINVDRFMVVPFLPTVSTLATYLELWKMRIIAKKEHLPLEIHKGAKQKGEKKPRFAHDHKKFVIFDAGTEHAHAYVGSSNIAGAFWNWRDYIVHAGKHTAEALEQDFEKTWNKENVGLSHYTVGQEEDRTEILTQSLSYKGPDDLNSKAIQEIRQAQRRVWFETTYVSTDVDHDPTHKALLEAKARGLDVKVILPRRWCNDPRYMLFANNWRNPLSDAGIDVYIHRGSFDHAKTLIADDTAMTGSLNFTDDKIAGGNAELLFISQDADYRKRMEKWYESGIEHSKRYRRRGRIMAQGTLR